MPDLMLNKSDSVTSSGTKSLGFNWGTNSSRNPVVREYTVSSSQTGVSAQNKMIVTQEGAALSINSDVTSPMEVPSESTAKSITINGTANGRYMRYLSPTLTVSSCKEYSGSVAGKNVGTTDTEVEEFGETYNFSLTATIPANATAANHTITLYTSDTEGATGDGLKAKSFVVEVTQDDPVSRIDVSPTSVTLSTSSSSTKHTQQLSVTIAPPTADQGVQFFSDDSSVATVTRYDGLITAVSEGSCSITARADGDYSKWALCQVQVFDPGIIRLDAINIAGSYNEGSSTIRTTNVEPETLEIHYSSGSKPNWVNSLTINSDTTPYHLVADVAGNGTIDNPGQARSFEVYLTGTDNLGDAITSNTIVVTQYAPSTSDNPCRNMEITMYDSTIQTPNNIGSYWAVFDPLNTTQHELTWYLTYRDGSANPTRVSDLGTSVPSTIAEIVTDDTEHTEHTQECVVRVNTGATTSQQLRVWVVNSYNFSVRDYVDVTAIYVEPNGYISASPNPVTVGWNDTSNDSTNGAPVVTLTNMRDPVTSLTTSFTGGITSATVQGSGNTGYVVTTFPVNPTPSTQIDLGTVTLYGVDAGGTSRSYTIQYKQSAQPAALDDEVQVSALNSTINSGNFDIIAVGNLINNHSVSSEFSNIVCRVDGYNSSNPGTVISTTGAMTLPNATVPPLNRNWEIRFYGTMSASADINRYRVTLSATSFGKNLPADVRDGLEGDDYIDDVPGEDDIH